MTVQALDSIVKTLVILNNMSSGEQIEKVLGINRGVNTESGTKFSTRSVSVWKASRD